MRATHGEKREEEGRPGGDVGGEQVVDVDSSLEKKKFQQNQQIRWKTTDLRSENKIKEEEDGQHKKGNQGLKPGVKS